MSGVLLAGTTRPWVVARNAHFDVYSHQGPERAQAGLAWFEQLSRFFRQNGVIDGLQPNRGQPVKVVAFGSAAEYDALRPNANAIAFYAGTPEQGYIVLPDLSRGSYGLAAHEYAHWALHNRGLNIPAWLSEGLAELFSTVRISGQDCEFGGDLPPRTQALRRNTWIPLSELLEGSALGQNRDQVEMFYAESWALAGMLALSPEYAPRFKDFVSTLNSGASGASAFASVYGKRLAEVAKDVSAWVTRTKIPRRVLLPVGDEKSTVEISDVSEFQAELLKGELLVAQGEWTRAEAAYRELLRQSPNDPNVLTTMGTLALHRGDRAEALRFWQSAMAAGDGDAALCYRFALVADDAGLPSAEIATALERAVTLRPDFDNARFKLALLRSNAGNYESAVEQLRAMRPPSGSRAFAYWNAMSYAQAELGHREESANAAHKASEHAVTDTERARAAQLLYIADTDLNVQFSRDDKGQARLVTRRIPHGAADWNPFSEPGDQLRRAEGTLREIQCENDSLTGLVVDTESGPLALSVPDPSHVLMRNGPSEFNCGAASVAVTVEYAAATDGRPGVLRGLEYR
jgi:tetratricopeptide (TPR) repeat protein